MHELAHRMLDAVFRIGALGEIIAFILNKTDSDTWRRGLAAEQDHNKFAAYDFEFGAFFSAPVEQTNETASPSIVTYKRDDKIHATDLKPPRCRCE